MPSKNPTSKTPSAVRRLFPLPRGLKPALLVLLPAVLAACGQGAPAGAGAGAGGMPPTPVGVITVHPGNVSLSTDLPGRLESLRTAQVRARVNGVILKRNFTEGGLVQAGQSLFAIDPAPYKAALESAVATQARAEAALAQAQANLERNKPLADAKAISPQDWLALQTAQKQALADVASAKAGVTTAKLNVEYAAVTAPISGRIGRASVTEGALVTATEGTLLATIQQTDKLYVNFTQSATEAMRLRRAVEAGKLQRSDSTSVKIVLEDGSVYPLPGKLLFSDVTVDQSTGQVSLRAEVPNPKGELLPGLYVKARIETARSDAAILVPQQAVSRGTAGDTVLVVGEDKVPAVRPVQLGSARDGQWVVLSGLKDGDVVVVDGFQKIRPKAPVTPVPWSASAPAGGAPAGGAPAASAPASAASH